MNGESINAVVRCAFKICYIYFLKCFLPSISLGSNINLFSSTDYDRRLKEQINHMKRLLTSTSAVPSTEKTQEKVTDGVPAKTDKKQSKPPKQEESDKSSEKNSAKTSDYTDTDEHDASIKDAAYSEIKKTIANQLKEKYGNDICVEFNYEDNDKNKEKMLYSLKIKRLGTSTPNPDDYADSDIYVNTKNKTFNVRSGKGFTSFPLIKHSIVKCERS